MRWIVEVSSIGKIDKQAYCVDSESWQRALQAARGLRDDHASMTGFSIELLDEGFSAVDPMTRLRYFIRRAPDDAPLTPSKPASQAVAPTPAPGIAAAKSSSSAPQPSSGAGKLAPRPEGPAVSTPAKKPNFTKTVVFGSTGTALTGDDKNLGASPAPDRTAHPAPAPIRSEPPRPTPSVKPHPPSDAPVAGSSVAPPVAPWVTPSAPPVAPHVAEPRAIAPRPASLPPPEPPPSQTLPGIEVLFKREQDPDARSPLSYREYMYFFAGASDETIAKAMLVAQFDIVKTSLERVKAGKLVNLAMFDVTFTGKPPVMPVVTLSWKDWKGEPVIEFPRRAATPPPVAAPDAPPPSSGGAVFALTTPRAAPATPVEPPTVETVAPALAPARAPSPSQSQIGGVRRTSSKPNIRLRGDELIADLFEVMHDLHFLRDSVEGADFCLTLALEKIPARVGIVHLYDIDRREFVVTAVRGPGRETALLRRYPESDPILTAAMRKQRAIVFSDTNAANDLDRYRAFGGAKSLVVAPVVLAGRFLGALELIDPLDGFPFSENEGYALTYIAEQFAEFVATRGVNVDPERIAASARAP